MPPDVAQYEALSISSRRALGFAEAAACLRARRDKAEIELADLLVGLLLAHPDRDGEARVLLTHFGLTARDVLPPDYPVLPADELRRYAEHIDIDEWPPLSGLLQQEILAVGAREIHLTHLLGAVLRAAGNGQHRLRLEDRLGAAGTSLSALAGIYDGWLAHDGARTGVAGAALRATLERELPRRPVDVPSYAADRVGAGDDLIGIRREVDAFAYLLVSKAQRPPLAVGLFGDWGSGKSFFMHAVRHRIAAIEDQIAERPQADVPFWKHVRQIEFNAWEYVRGTLWASLLDHIFRELDGQHLNLVQVRRQELLTAHAAATQRASERESERDRLVEALPERRAALQRAERAREVELAELDQRRCERIADELEAARKTAWAGAASELAGSDAAELAGALADARAELLRGRGLLGAYWSAPRVLLATLAALAVPGVALVAADVLDFPPVVAALGGLSAIVPATTALLRSSTRWTRAQLDRIERLSRELEAELAERERELDADVEAARAELERAETALDEVASAQRAAQDEAASLQGALAELTPGRVLGDFLQERSSSDDYRQHLGLLARVREDLGKLEQLVRANNESGGEVPDGAPPNRIILYIDDLDRCTSEKVVEVLEAVHLLLAFELFVVVVAVDSRWLSFALTDELRALDTVDRGGRRATPQDYLEKIFQLPFWVQPLTSDGRRSLVHGLLEGAIRPTNGKAHDGKRSGARLALGPGEEELLATMLSRRGADPRLDAHVLALSPEDLRFIESLAPLLGDTPRRVKRFVNVTQLLLALPPSLEQDASQPPDRFVVAFLAAVCSGLPGLAPRLFDAVTQSSTVPLAEAVASLAGAPVEERERLEAWLRSEPAWSVLPLARLDTRLDVVRRLTFDRAAASALK